MDHVEIHFRDVPGDVREIVMAMLSDSGYEGFEEKDNDLLAYISRERFDPDFVAELSGQFNLHFDQQEIPEANWNAVWESNFEPVVVERFCAVRAAFHDRIADVEHDIVITPKMSFGTGHHATTYMMVQQMGEIIFSGKPVLDFGTGTGILAILAEKLGASAIVAIDNDENSISNALENISMNNCRNISVLLRNDADTGNRFDIILANITRNVILDNFHYFTSALQPGGTLLLSGLLENDRPFIMRAAAASRFSLVAERAMDKWLCLRFCR